MPLPIIIIGAIVLGSAVGVGAAAVGVSDINEAERRRNSAKRKHDNSKDKTERTRRQFMRRAGIYGDLQIDVARDTVGGFLSLLEELKRHGQSPDMLVLDDLKISPTELRDDYQNIVDLSEALKSGAGGALSGAMAGGTASTATVGLVGLFASASTGTPIGLLSGAAAKSATLAWLGGGPLAVGGGGMALGSIVLGGIVVAPALIVGGFMLAAKGEEALSQAAEYESKVNVACEQLKSLCDFLERAKKRLDELEKVLKGLSERAQVAMARIDPGNFDFSRTDDLARFTEAFTLVNGTVDILKAPVLDEEGKLSSDSAEVLAKYRKYRIESSRDPKQI